jgi:hypothetical protein
MIVVVAVVVLESPSLSKFCGYKYSSRMDDNDNPRKAYDSSLVVLTFSFQNSVVSGHGKETHTYPFWNYPQLNEDMMMMMIAMICQ